jgi:hypothetical protein
MTTPRSQRLDALPERALPDDGRRRHRSRTPDPSRLERVSIVARPRPATATVTRGAEQLRATWASVQGCFELIVGVHAAGLHVKLCSWMPSGSTLEECFVIHALPEFEQWLARSPTKFDHPVAHEELRRFAHGSLSR